MSGTWRWPCRDNFETVLRLELLPPRCCTLQATAVTSRLSTATPPCCFTSRAAPGRSSAWACSTARRNTRWTWGGRRATGMRGSTSTRGSGAGTGRTVHRYRVESSEAAEEGAAVVVMVMVTRASSSDLDHPCCDLTISGNQA